MCAQLAGTAAGCCRAERIFGQDVGLCPKEYTWRSCSAGAGCSASRSSSSYPGTLLPHQWTTSSHAQTQADVPSIFCVYLLWCGDVRVTNRHSPPEFAKLGFGLVTIAHTRAAVSAATFMLAHAPCCPAWLTSCQAHLAAQEVVKGEPHLLESAVQGAVSGNAAVLCTALFVHQSAKIQVPLLLCASMCCVMLGWAVFLCVGQRAELARAAYAAIMQCTTNYHVQHRTFGQYCTLTCILTGTALLHCCMAICTRTEQN